MAVEFKESDAYSFDHMRVQERVTDGAQNGWRISAHEGHVIYNAAANDTELDPSTMEEKPVVYYRRSIDRPMNFSFDDFTWVAVPEEEVNAEYIM